MEKKITSINQSNCMEFPELRFFAAIGIISPIFFSSMWAMSAMFDGTWTFGADSLSRMGISENPLSAFLFNSACMITGIFGMVFGFGISHYGKKANSISGSFFCVASFFLTLVGVFTMDQGIVHYIVASMFAILLAIGAVFSFVGDLGFSWHPYADAVFFTVSFALILTQPFPLWEAVLTIGAMLWTMAQSVRIMNYENRFRRECFNGEKEP